MIGGGSDLVVSARDLLLGDLGSGLTARRKPHGRRWFRPSLQCSMGDDNAVVVLGQF